MTITLIFFTVIYCIIIAIFIVGWYAIPIYKRPLKSNQLPALSVIICCRNEAENLPALIASLKAQSFQNFEMIFANDHSTDN
ncbi:MAG TPA: glycosyltransferase, partial [Paludibacteraceae bacterium]|nr:glycosyltransferase [Paludibacteraceae bacterium]